MAILDLSHATKAVIMTDPNLIGFGAVEAATSTVWSYLTPTGHDLQLEGQGMTFDGQGRALTGAVTSIGIDLGNDDFENPDIVITGINAAAASLDDGAAGFWRLLEGDDTIIGPQFANTGSGSLSEIFGDGITARTGNTSGGHDVILHGGSRVFVNGDVTTVGSQTAGTPATVYQGGNDEVQGVATDFLQFLVGDTGNVYATGRLLGGNDSILAMSSDIASVAIGDAALIQGTAGDRAEVFGGNDLIVAGLNSGGRLIGDVAIQVAYSFVSGGNDRISGGEQGETVVGDVYDLTGGEAVGGADTIFGNGGDDYLYGDVYRSDSGTKVTGGNDRIYGGAGNDRIYGEGGVLAEASGGNDQLFGEAGDDHIYGQTGNDLLDGGVGNDNLQGGAGNDTYVIDSASDFVFEDANEGIGTVRSYFGTVTLKDNFEHLTFIGTGNFTGSGNGLGNTIRGGAGVDLLNGFGGNDRLYGGAGDDGLFDDAGDDVLNGGAGGDNLVGGDGFDTASYAGSEQAVKVALDGGFAATGDALGDTFNAIEGLEGSSFNDVLRGDANANTLNGGLGADTMIGLGGNDKFIVDSASDVVIETAGGGTADRVYASVSYQLAAGAEVEILNTSSNGGTGAINLVGNKFAQTIIGNAGNNIINGLGGIDTMQGLGGNDSYYVDNSADVIIEAVGGGTDRVLTSASYSLKPDVEVELLTTTNAAGTDALKLAGNAFANTVIGNAGDNFINGAAGADTLRGLGGNDTFMFNTALGAGNIDDITDFNVADDTIRLENGIFTAILGTGVLTAIQFAANASGTAQDATDRIIYETDTGKLFYDENGSAAGGAVQFATLDAGLALTNADFFIV